MVRTLSPRAAEALLAATDTELVDVREPQEWASGHLPGARLVSLSTLKADPRATITRDRVLFVCQRGARSMTAAKLAESLGYSEIYSLDGGTEAWVVAGLPLAHPASPESKSRTTTMSPEAVQNPPPQEDAIDPALDAIVSENLRTIRAQRNVSLDTLAGLSGLSRSVLGQIELGRGAPSLAAVWKIAKAFDLPFSAFLATHEQARTQVLHRKSGKRLVSADERFASRALFPLGEQNKVEFYELWLAPHGRDDADAHPPGTRENLVVSHGRLELQVGGEQFELGPGDAIWFGADVPHSYVNPSSEECWMYLVMTYGDAGAKR